MKKVKPQVGAVTKKDSTPKSPAKKSVNKKTKKAVKNSIVVATTTPPSMPPNMCIPAVVIKPNTEDNIHPAAQIQEPAPIQNHDENRLEFGNEIRAMINTGGTLVLTPEQNQILFAAFSDSDVFMKPDGLIYLTWGKYSKRLSDAFTGMGWVMIPEGMPKENNQIIYWGFHMVIKGVYCGFAMGEQQYFNNNRMTYGEACEGAKSNALTRLCKGMGIGIQLWDKAFIERWLTTYATFKWVGGEEDGSKRKKVYTLKDPGGSVHTQTNYQKTTPPPPPGSDLQSKPSENKTNKLPENDGFVKQPPIRKETQVSGSKRLEEFKTEIRNAKTMSELGIVYTAVQVSFKSRQITMEEKETLRVMANERGTALSRK